MANPAEQSSRTAGGTAELGPVPMGTGAVETTECDSRTEATTDNLAEVELPMSSSTQSSADLTHAAQQFRKYNALFSQPVSGGGLAPINSAVWSILLEHQATSGVAGNMIEIGVWYGHGSAMAALFRQPGERMILVDKFMTLSHSEPNLVLSDPDVSAAIDFHQGDSTSMRKRQALSRYRDTVRWAHIDGEHSFEAVVNDLDLVAELVRDGGIVVLDDFFNFSSPSCTEAAFHWLGRNQEKLCLFMCGFNKAYLCSPRDLRSILKVAHDMPNRLEALGFSVMVCMSGWSAERPYFGLDHALPGKKYQQIGNALDEATLSQLFFDV